MARKEVKKGKLAVKDIMSKGNDNAVVKEDDILRDAIEEMNSKKLGVVNVVDTKGVLKGIITDGDLRRLILNTQDTLPELFNRRCSEVMNKKPRTIESNTPLDKALKILEDLSVWVLPVVEGRVCVGTVHLHKLLRTMFR